MSTVPNPLYGKDTVATFAGKIRQKFPEGVSGDGRKYSQIPDEELTHSVIQKHPVYQNWLSNDELQRLTKESFSATPAAAGNLQDLAGGMTGTPHGSLGEVGSKLKNAAHWLLNRSPDQWVESGLDALNDAGQSQIDSVRAHEGGPLHSVAAIPFVGPKVAQTLESPNFRNAGELLQAGLTLEAPKVGAGVGRAVSNISTAPARTALAQKLVQPLVYEGVGEAGADTRLGIQPDRGLVREGIWGTRKSMARQAGERVGQLKPAADSVLQNSPGANTPIDATGHINTAVDEAIQNAEAEGRPDVAPQLENLRQALLTKHGPTSGTPFEMNNLKSSIQNVAKSRGAYKNTVPLEGSAANAASGAARGIKNDVNAAVPEGVQLNERMADLMDAQEGLNRGIEAQKGKDIFSGDLWSIPNRMIQRTAASPLVRSGLARVLTLGNKLDVPTVMPAPLPPQTELFAGEPEAPPSAPPAPPTAHVGQLPSLGFPPTMPDPMWTPRATPSAPTWSLPDRSQPFTTPSEGALPPSPPPVVPSPQGGAPPSGNAPAPTGSAPQSSSVPPSVPPGPWTDLAPINPIAPQELADLTATLRSQGYQGPITPENAMQLMRQANEVRTNQQMMAGRPDAVSANREAHRAKLAKAPR